MSSRTNSAKRTHDNRTRAERSEERRQRRIRVGVSLFMVFLMVFSTVAYFFTPNPNSFTYNGVRFRAEVENGIIQGFSARIDGEERVFYARPGDSQFIGLPEGFPESLRDAQIVVILVNPEDNLTPLYDAFRFQLERSFGANPLLVPAVTTESATYPFPVYTCDQATPEAPVLFLTQGPVGITADENNPSCITVSGSQYEYALLHDRILYRYFGVTET